MQQQQQWQSTQPPSTRLTLSQAVEQLHVAGHAAAAAKVNWLLSKWSAQLFGPSVGIEPGSIPIAALLMPAHLNAWLLRLNEKLQQQGPNRLPIRTAAAYVSALVGMLRLRSVQEAVGPGSMQLMVKQLSSCGVVQEAAAATANMPALRRVTPTPALKTKAPTPAEPAAAPQLQPATESEPVPPAAAAPATVDAAEDELQQAAGGLTLLQLQTHLTEQLGLAALAAAQVAPLRQFAIHEQGPEAQVDAVQVGELLRHVDKFTAWLEARYRSAAAQGIQLQDSGAAQPQAPGGDAVQQQQQQGQLPPHYWAALAASQCQQVLQLLHQPLVQQQVGSREQLEEAAAKLTAAHDRFLGL